MKTKTTQLQIKSKRKRNGLRLGAPARWVLLLSFLVVGSLVKDIYWQIRLGQQEKNYQKTLESLDAQYESLSATRERLNSDDDYVEGLIRSTFKYARPGELVVPLDDVDPDVITVSLTDKR